MTAAKRFFIDKNALREYSNIMKTKCYNILHNTPMRMQKITVTLIVLLLLNSVSIPAYSASSGTTSDDSLPDVRSETAVLMDAVTGQVLYQKDMDRRMYPASITKIMTGMLALKYGKLTDTVTMSKEAVSSVDKDSANIALFTGEQLPLEQVLYALSVASANDAANGIAEHIGGTMDNFVAMMNDAAKAAGAVNTHFANASGLPDDAHYTTARDMALITAQALTTPGFAEIFSTKRYKIPPTNKQPETRILNSSNRLLNGDIPYDGLLMSKVGWTVEAQHTLVTAAERDGTTLVAVVMKAADSTVKWTDTVSLLDYGFNQFTRVTIQREDILQAAPDDLEVPGQSGALDPETYDTQDVSLLLPKALSPEDIQISYGVPLPDADAGRVTIPLRLVIQAGASQNGTVDLPGATVTAALRPVSPAAGDDENPEPGAQTSGILRIILITGLSVLGLLMLAFAFLLVRRAVIVRRRKRKKTPVDRYTRR
jgi:D-alanyl-D-alanine carboxypeptidase (penicillin-binding protein 5/6)